MFSYTYYNILSDNIVQLSLQFNTSVTIVYLDVLTIRRTIMYNEV